MERRIFLVDAFNTSDHFELSVREGTKLFRADAIEFCLGDSLRYDFIAVHATSDEPSAYLEAVQVISRFRGETNPLTGEPMKIINLFPPQSKANAN